MAENSYNDPQHNRGDKDPYKLSERIKLYGESTSFQVYDYDNYEDVYVVTRNFTTDKIFELKGAQLKEGIIVGPAAKIGQLCQLYFNVYPCYLSYCLVYNNGEELYNWISVPANYAAVLQCKRNKAIQLSEKRFALDEFGYGSNVKENSITDNDKVKLKGAQLKVPDTEIIVPTFPYKSFLEIEEQVKKNRFDKKEKINFNFYDKGLAQLLENDKIYSIWTELQAEGIDFLNSL